MKSEHYYFLKIKMCTLNLPIKYPYWIYFSVYEHKTYCKYQKVCHRSKIISSSLVNKVFSSLVYKKQPVIHEKLNMFIKSLKHYTAVCEETNKLNLHSSIEGKYWWWMGRISTTVLGINQLTEQQVEEWMSFCMVNHMSWRKLREEAVTWSCNGKSHVFRHALSRTPTLLCPASNTFHSASSPLFGCCCSLSEQMLMAAWLDTDAMCIHPPSFIEWIGWEAWRFFSLEHFVTLLLAGRGEEGIPRAP